MPPLFPWIPAGKANANMWSRVCHFVDAGTSILLSAQAHDAFREETAEDRDPGILTHLWTATHAHLRSRHALGGQKPRTGFSLPAGPLSHQPGDCTQYLSPASARQKCGTLERYHRTYKQECLLVHHPSTLSEVRSVTEQFLYHYHEERPLKAALLRESSPACSLPRPASAFPAAHDSPAQPLAAALSSARLCAHRGFGWLCHGRLTDLLPLAQASRPARCSGSRCSGAVLCCLASYHTPQPPCHQGSAGSRRDAL